MLSDNQYVLILLNIRTTKTDYEALRHIQEYNISNSVYSHFHRLGFKKLTKCYQSRAE
jgi:hypothetical protein